MKPGKKPFEFKVCPACLVDKPRHEYYKKLETVSYLCKECTKIDLKIRSPKYFGKYSDYQNSWKREQTIKNTQYNQRRKALKTAIYQKNKDSLNAKRRHEWSTNPNCSAKKHNRHHHVKNNTPIWANLDEINVFYKNCPEGFHVDHIIPLKGRIDGRLVSGLHILQNLQYLTAEKNRKKHCYITESYLANIDC